MDNNDFEKEKLKRMESVYPVSIDMRNAFEEGANWAKEWLEKKFSWNPYPEQPPKEDEEYLVSLGNDNVDIYSYDTRKGEFGYLSAGKLGDVEWKSINDCVKEWKEIIR